MSTKVLIMGGGIAGLSLAHGLKKHNIPFHVYERDRTEAYRAQGYRIRIGGPAVDALQYLLNDKTYEDFELSCANLRMMDIPEIDAETGRVDEPNVSDAIRITGDDMPKAWCVDRSNVRSVFIKNLAEDEISYDKVFERYEETEDGVVAHFADGTTAKGSLIVGAEGKSTRVRKQLVPQLEVADTGIRCLYGKTPITPEVRATLEPSAGERMSFIKDRTHEAVAVAGLEPITFPHRKELESRGLSCPPDYLFWVLTGSPAALGLENPSQRLGSEESEKYALEISEKWHPGLRTIIEHQQKGESAAFAIEAVNATLPVWEANQHVTVMGDAIHPMAPTGSGAVTAMRDAHVLCRKLVEMGQTKEAIRSYEDDMREAAGKAVGMSWGMIRKVATMGKDDGHMGEMAMMIRAKNVGKTQ